MTAFSSSMQDKSRPLESTLCQAYLVDQIQTEAEVQRASVSDLTAGLGFLLAKAHYAMRRQLNRRMALHGIELPSEQCAVLMTLGLTGPVTQQGLAERLMKDKAGVSRLVKGMEEKGLIRRVHGINDRRANVIELTELGESRLSLIDTHLSEIRKDAVAEISAADLKACYWALIQIAANLE